MEGKVEFDPGYWSHVSDQAKNLIKGLLEAIPVKRLTVDQALEHPWLQAQDEELAKHQLSMAELRKHLIRRKLRALLRAVLMTQRLKRLSFISKRSISARSSGSESSLPSSPVASPTKTPNDSIFAGDSTTTTTICSDP
jgi:serine/threonine protein kinase